MDIFGKKRIRALEKQLELKTREIESLKTDLNEVEREHFDLKAKYKPNKGPHVIRSKSSVDVQLVSSRNNPASSQPAGFSNTCQSGSSDNLIAGAMLGTAVALTLSDTEGCDSNSGVSDCSGD